LREKFQAKLRSWQGRKFLPCFNKILGG
jgi:hypothetical protein